MAGPNARRARVGAGPMDGPRNPGNEAATIPPRSTNPPVKQCRPKGDIFNCRYALDTFINTSPLTINTAAPIRIALTCSPRNTMPTMNAPTAPMPVQIV